MTSGSKYSSGSLKSRDSVRIKAVSRLPGFPSPSWKRLSNPVERTSMETSRRSGDLKPESSSFHDYPSQPEDHPQHTENTDYPPMPMPIMLTPPTPRPADGEPSWKADEDVRLSLDSGGKEKDTAGKKVQKMLKNRVHKGQQRITTIGKRIGHGVGRSGSLSLRRTTSTPGECSPAVVSSLQ